jgi:methylenetetrahydrofolate reductase (NADPH)
MTDGFELVCEVEPPTRPELKKVRHQIGVMSPIADAFLIPDNHIGRATVRALPSPTRSRRWVPGASPA